jgi:hypothetical protein
MDGEPFTVEVCDGTVATRLGPASSPAIRLDTNADTFVGLMTGRVSPTDSLADGRADLEGSGRRFSGSSPRSRPGHARSPFRL